MLQLLKDWWNSLTPGAQDQIFGGLVVAGVVSLIGAVWALLRFFATRAGLSRLRTNASIPLNEKFSDEFLPKPPNRRVKIFIKRHDSGNHDIVELIKDRLKEERLVTIWGSGGVGKTTIAIETANAIAPTLPGGVVWTSAEERADFDIPQLQDDICTQLGWHYAARPFYLDSKTSATRMLLGQRSCLLVLDGFELIVRQQQDAMLAFLEDAPCKVLITSRQRLSRGENIHLGPMTTEEVDEYFKSLIEHSTRMNTFSDIDLHKIAKLADRNPLAIRWVVRQLELGIQVEDIVDDLSHGSGEAAERIFGRSFNLLPNDAQLVLLNLCLFTASASKEAIKDTSCLEREQLRVSIRLLAQLDLVTLENERLSVVGLVRRFARIPAEIITEFHLRLITHYVNAARLIDYYKDPSGLDSDYENLIGLLDWCLKNEKWREALLLFDATGEFLTDWSGFEARLMLANSILTAARSVGDARAYAWHAIYSLAWVYLREGMINEAKPIIEESLDWGRRNSCHDVIALGLRSSGLIAKKQGKYEEARRLISESLSIWQEIGDKRWAAMSLTYLGEIALEQSDLALSQSLLIEAKDAFAKQGNEEGLAWTKDVLGQVLLARGQIIEARQYFVESTSHRQRMKAPSGTAHTEMSLAKLEMSEGNLEEAMAHAKKAHQIYSQLGAQVWQRDAEDRINLILRQIRKSPLQHLVRRASKFLRRIVKAEIRPN